jgi:hypothetical protein
MVRKGYMASVDIEVTDDKAMKEDCFSGGRK